MSISESNRKRIEEALAALKNEESKPDDAESDDDSDSSSSESEDDEGSSQVAPTRRKREQRAGVIVQIDDEADEDLVLFLDEGSSYLKIVNRQGFQMFNSENIPGRQNVYKNIEMVSIVTQKQIKSGHHPNRQLAAILRDIYQSLSYMHHSLQPCIVLKLDYSVQISKDDGVQVCLTAMVSGQPTKDAQVIKAPSISRETSFRSPSLSEGLLYFEQRPVFPDLKSNRSSVSSNQDELVHEFEEGENEIELTPTQERRNESQTNINNSALRRSSHYNSRSSQRFRGSPMALEGVIEITPLASLPSQISHFNGRISLHFIKETHLAFETCSGMNGMGGFTAVFMHEMMAVVRAHTLALGGNAVVGFSIDQSLFSESVNYGYALVSISGDVVRSLPEDET